MKKLIVPLLAGIAAMPLLTGCVMDLSRGPTTAKQTVGQQLVDLKKAKDAGAISDAEYQAEKAKLLGQK